MNNFINNKLVLKNSNALKKTLEHLEIINKENANVIPCVDRFNKVKFYKS